MRRLILLLPLSLSPVYAIGFWGSLGGGLNFGGFGEIGGKVNVDGDTATSKIGASPKGFIFGGNLMGGISLQPIPIAVGLGVDYYTGKQKYKFKDGQSTEAEDTFTLEVNRIYIKLPVAYQLSLPVLKGYFGIYPAYALYSWKVKEESDSEGSVFLGGFAFGGFTNLYYSLGRVGLGGGIFVDYAPSLKWRKDNVEVFINKVFHYGINLGLLVSLGGF